MKKFSKTWFRASRETTYAPIALPGIQVANCLPLTPHICPSIVYEL